MSMFDLEFDLSCIRKAIQLALQAEQEENLPIGAVISLDGAIVAEGKNAIWFPKLNLRHHAEMEALGNIPPTLLGRAPEMTLYTTLEPCLMCMGAILLHQIGRVVYGSSDGYGGALTVFGHLPSFFEEQRSKMTLQGPVYPEECDLLYARMTALEHRKNQTLPGPGIKS